MRDITVDRIMVEEMKAVDPDVSVADAARTLRDADVGALLVGDPPTFQGIISERDIVYKGVADDRDLNELTARDIMTSDITYGRVNDSIHDCYQVMIENGFRHLPIQDNQGHTVGIVSIRSLFSRRDDDHRFKIDQLERYIRDEH